MQVAGDATFHYWAVANPGYIFTGWYTAEGALQSSGAAHISKKVTAGQAGGSDTHAYADFYASFIKQIQLSFVVPTNGSFTITHKGSEVTPAYSSFTTEGKVVLTALPAADSPSCGRIQTPRMVHYDQWWRDEELFRFR